MLSTLGPINIMDEEGLLRTPYIWRSDSMTNRVFQFDVLGGFNASYMLEEKRSDILINICDPVADCSRNQTIVKPAYLLEKPQLPAQSQILISLFATPTSGKHNSSINQDNSKGVSVRPKGQPITHPTRWFCHICGNVQGMQTPACTNVLSSGNICGHRKCSYCRVE